MPDVHNPELVRVLSYGVGVLVATLTALVVFFLKRLLSEIHDAFAGLRKGLTTLGEDLSAIRTDVELLKFGYEIDHERSNGSKMAIRKANQVKKP